MKTLILFGSPKKNGETANLLNSILKDLSGEIILVDCFKQKISPCLDCDYCKNNACCMIKDDMQIIYDELPDADNIIIASPVYFSELTGKIFDVISRLQVFYYSKEFSRFKKKKGLLVLTGGGDGDAQPAIDSAKRFLKVMKADEIKDVCSLYTDDVPVLKDENALEQAKKVAKWLQKTQ